MRILYICHRLPYPPNRGGKIRPFNMIKHLHGQGHEIVVASLARTVAEAEEGEGLERHCSEVILERIGGLAALARMLARLPTTIPSSMGYFCSPRLNRRIRTALATRRFDFILVHCSSVARYVADISGTPKLLDFGDMDSQKWLMYSRVRRFPLSVGYQIEGIKLQRAESALARQFDLCTCTTAAEMRTLEEFKTGARTAWFPNGVDHDYFSPGDREPDPNLLSFMGRMDYYPNATGIIGFCERTLPLIRERKPAIKLLIVGAKPTPAVRELRRLEGVEVTGWVPDVREHVRGSAVSIAPLEIARGTQNKILEAMAMGVPVVASDAAAGGIDAIPGEHFLTASSPESFAREVLGLLDDPAKRRALAQAGRARVLSHHSWDHSMTRLDALIEECLSDRTGQLSEGASEDLESTFRR